MGDAGGRAVSPAARGRDLWIRKNLLALIGAKEYYL
jgi:hypothetical protein